jgi:hypothetical protein
MSGAKKSGTRAKLKAEVKKTRAVFVYLSLFFGAVTTCRPMRGYSTRRVASSLCAAPLAFS